jgi:hypothetical protein
MFNLYGLNLFIGSSQMTFWKKNVYMCFQCLKSTSLFINLIYYVLINLGYQLK